MFSKNAFQYITERKTLRKMRSKNRRLMSKVYPTILRRRSCGLCEAVNSLIKQSAEKILHTLLNGNKNKFQEENHHFIFSVPYGEIP